MAHGNTIRHSARIEAAIAGAKAVLLPAFLTPADLAQRLSLSISTVQSHLRDGTLPGRKIGQRWVIERNALLQALKPVRKKPLLRLLREEEGE